MGFGTVGIFGVGLLGGSLGLALKAQGLSEKVVGIGRNRQRLQLAFEKGAVDEVSTDLSEAASGIDLLVIATPVELIPDFAEQAAEKMKPGSIITDVGSTKERIVVESEKRLEGGLVHFIGSHPMAGSEKTGVQAARKELFQGAICFVTPSDRTAIEALDIVEQLWKSVGGRTQIVSPDKHDRLVAISSHLPHLLASMLSYYAKDQHKALEELTLAIGTGFKDTTRIAAGSEELWTDICLHNKDNLIDTLTEFKSLLEQLLAELGAENVDEIERILRIGREFRENLNNNSHLPGTKDI